MPEFGSPFSGLANDRKLTDEELVRAIRFMVAAEYEAIQLYMQLAESTDNKARRGSAQRHRGRGACTCWRVPEIAPRLSPDEEEFYAEGAEEVEEEITRMK